MKAIILAAGRGSRMKALTDERPKCLVEVHGKLLLDWQLDALKGAGISEIGVVTGYKRELLVNRGLIEFHNPHWAATQMVSSLCCAQEWLNAGPCIVSYSDIFYETQAVVSLADISADLAITYDPNWHRLWSARFDDPLADAETFRLSDGNKLVEIGNKPRTVAAVQGQYMGLLRFTPKSWAEVQRIRSTLSSSECAKMHMTGTLQKVIDAGNIQILAVPYDQAWGEVDSADDLIAYRDEPFQGTHE